jgi:flagellar basal body-associated protein FliL
MPDPNRKSEPSSFDPIDAEKLLELELMQKRQSWAQAKQRRGSLRTISLFFLLLVIVAAIYAFTLFFSPARMQELRAKAARQPSPTPLPAATP